MSVRSSVLIAAAMIASAAAPAAESPSAGGPSAERRSRIERGSVSRQCLPGPAGYGEHRSDRYRAGRAVERTAGDSVRQEYDGGRAEPADPAAHFSARVQV